MDSEKRNMGKELNDEFDVWFVKLETVAEKAGSQDKLVPEDWTEYWFDRYTPQAAWDEEETADAE